MSAVYQDRTQQSPERVSYNSLGCSPKFCPLKKELNKALKGCPIIAWGVAPSSVRLNKALKGCPITAWGVAPSPPLKKELNSTKP